MKRLLAFALGAALTLGLGFFTACQGKTANPVKITLGGPARDDGSRSQKQLTNPDRQGPVPPAQAGTMEDPLVMMREIDAIREAVALAYSERYLQARMRPQAKSAPDGAPQSSCLERIPANGKPGEDFSIRYSSCKTKIDDRQVVFSGQQFFCFKPKGKTSCGPVAFSPNEHQSEAVIVNYRMQMGIKSLSNPAKMNLVYQIERQIDVASSATAAAASPNTPAERSFVVSSQAAFEKVGGQTTASNEAADAGATSATADAVAAADAVDAVKLVALEGPRKSPLEKPTAPTSTPGPKKKNPRRNGPRPADGSEPSRSDIQVNSWSIHYDSLKILFTESDTDLSQIKTAAEAMSNWSVHLLGSGFLRVDAGSGLEARSCELRPLSSSGDSPAVIEYAKSATCQALRPVAILGFVRDQEEPMRLELRADTSKPPEVKSPQTPGSTTPSSTTPGSTRKDQSSGASTADLDDKQPDFEAGGFYEFDPSSTEKKAAKQTNYEACKSPTPAPTTNPAGTTNPGGAKN